MHFNQFEFICARREILNADVQLSSWECGNARSPGLPSSTPRRRHSFHLRRARRAETTSINMRPEMGLFYALKIKNTSMHLWYIYLKRSPRPYLVFESCAAVAHKLHQVAPLSPHEAFNLTFVQLQIFLMAGSQRNMQLNECTNNASTFYRYSSRLGDGITSWTRRHFARSSWLLPAPRWSVLKA